MLLIDTHTHIYDAEFDLDREAVVQRALDNGVGLMLLPNVDASTIAPMLETHERFPDCTRMMMGLQPEEVKGDYKQVLAMMEKEGLRTAVTEGMIACLQKTIELGKK